MCGLNRLTCLAAAVRAAVGEACSHVQRQERGVLQGPAGEGKQGGLPGPLFEGKHEGKNTAQGPLCLQGLSHIEDSRHSVLCSSWFTLLLNVELKVASSSLAIFHVDDKE